MIKIKNDEVIKSFGKRIRELRIAQGLSQEELANIADMPLSQIGRIERAEINVTLITIAALANAFKIEIHQMLQNLNTK